MQNSCCKKNETPKIRIERTVHANKKELMVHAPTWRDFID